MVIGHQCCICDICVTWSENTAVHNRCSLVCVMVCFCFSGYVLTYSPTRWALRWHLSRWVSQPHVTCAGIQGLVRLVHLLLFCESAAEGWSCFLCSAIRPSLKLVLWSLAHVLPLRRDGVWLFVRSGCATEPSETGRRGIKMCLMGARLTELMG